MAYEMSQGSLPFAAKFYAYVYKDSTVALNVQKKC